MTWKPTKLAMPSAKLSIVFFPSEAREVSRLISEM